MKKYKLIKFKNKHRVNTCRFKNWDYRRPATYFVTINTEGNAFYFGEVVNGIMTKNEIGHIVDMFWMDIPNHFPHVKLGKFVIMPNHIHGIISLTDQLPFNDNKVNENFIEMELLHATALPGISCATLDEQAAVEPLHATAPVKKELISLKMSRISPKSGSLSTIIRSFKSAVTNKIHKMNLDFAWQKSFHEKIVHSKFSCLRIEKYIDQNPENWGKCKMEI